MVLNDPAVAECEAVGESPSDPFAGAMQTNSRVRIHDNLVAVLQELLGFAGSFGPRPSSFPDALTDFRDATKDARVRRTFELDALDLGIEIVGDRLHVIAIDR